MTSLATCSRPGSTPPAEVLVRYITSEMTEPAEVTWVDGNAPPVEIAQITVFDSQNARLYVDRQNRIGFLPAEIAILDRHGAHRRELDELFKAEIKAIDKKLKTPLPGGYSASGTIPQMLKRLDQRSATPVLSEDEIKELATFSAEEESELASLERRGLCGRAESLRDDRSEAGIRDRRVGTRSSRSRPSRRR
jgi:hypothetical protein